MPDLWKPIFALFCATLISVVGTVLIRWASDNGSIPVAIVGASLWSASAAGFVWASGRGVDLSIASAVMSAGGILSIQLIGYAFYDEGLSTMKIIALTFIVVALVLLACPTAKS